MTDNEIRKALECCINSDCKSCPCDTNPEHCKEIDDDGLLALINRQQAEIERLQNYNENLQTANIALSNEILEIKSEAIKEFAGRLKECSYTYSDICGYQSTVIDVADIDNLAKQMTEVSE